MKKIIMILFAVLLVVFVAVWRSYGDWARAIYDADISENDYSNVGELQGAALLTQETRSRYNNFSGFSIKISNLGQSVASELNYRITEKDSGKVLAEGIIDAARLDSEKFNIVKFDTVIENSKDKYFLIQIQDNSTAAGSGITIYTSERGENAGELTINGQSSNSALVMRAINTRFNVQHFIVFTFLILYLAAFIRALNKFLR